MLPSLAAGQAKPQPMSVPQVTNMPVANAQQILTQQGWKVNIQDKPVDNQAQAGRVVQQDPLPGTKLPKEVTVNLYVGTYQAPAATVPKVKGMPLAAAQKTMVSSRLNAVVTFENVTDKAKDNIVLKQTPSPGTSVNPKSTRIILTVGRDPRPLPPGAPIKPDSVNK